MENLNHYISHKNETCKNEKMPLIEAYFDDLEGNLIEKILQHKEGIIFGCVAWLTSEKILAALAQCNNVQIIVQKEDFLRPDMDSKFNWNNKIRSMY